MEKTERAEKIAQAVEETMEARLRPEPDPFFYDKLRARMEREAEPAAPIIRLAWLRPVAAGIFFLASTGFSLNIIFQQPSFSEGTSSTSSKDVVENEFYVGSGSSENFTFY